MQTLQHLTAATSKCQCSASQRCFRGTVGIRLGLFRSVSLAESCMQLFGAQERTRTSTPLRELAPEASASANSATWAKCGENGENYSGASANECQRELDFQPAAMML